MGGYGELVMQPQDTRPAMERARAAGKPSCVNVLLDPDIGSSATMHQTMYKECSCAVVGVYLTGSRLDEEYVACR